MTKARLLLYAHLLVTFVCVGLTVIALHRQAELGWRFSRQMEVIFARPVVSLAYSLCLLSSFAFPAAVAYAAVGRLSAWRWFLLVAAVSALSWVQFAALIIVYPVRE
jgi:hypothetical protein